MNRLMRRMNRCALWLALATPVVLVGCGGGGQVPGGVRLGQTRTFAGAGVAGSTDGPVAAARFNNPVNVATNAQGDVFVCEYDGSRIRRISNGVVDTIVSQANFKHPFGIAFLPDGRLFVQTDNNDTGAENGTSGTIWRVDIAARTATVVARNLGLPRGFTAYDASQLALSDFSQHDVRLLNVDTGAITPLAGSRGNHGFVNGTGTAARFNRPYGSVRLANGNLLVTDLSNHAIREITPAGVVTTLSGSGTAGFRDGAVAQAVFNGPQDLAVDSQGFIYVADNFNNRVRRIRNGIVETIAGDGTAGFQEGAGSQARFFGLEGIALSPDGTTLYVSDGNGGSGRDFNRIRSVHVR